ncbi:hypothetical protein IKG54_00465 [Candidatus Saccharibacteria bacterium]|nr:hypothetical protein [Candidatus Saccharibacteria bacterium]
MTIKDSKNGKSANYSTTPDGFKQAWSQIKTIESQSGHTATGSDAERVKNYAAKMGWQ